MASADHTINRPDVLSGWIILLGLTTFAPLNDAPYAFVYGSQFVYHEHHDTPQEQHEQKLNYEVGSENDWCVVSCDHFMWDLVAM